MPTITPNKNVNGFIGETPDSTKSTNEPNNNINPTNNAITRLYMFAILTINFYISQNEDPSGQIFSLAQ